MAEMTPEKEGMLLSLLRGLEVDTLGVASVAELPYPWLRDQVLALLPGAKSVVAFGMEVWREVLDHSKPEKIMGEGSARELVGTHTDYLTGRLNSACYRLGRECRRLGFRALPMPASRYPTDDRYLRAVLSYKHAAEAAGIGTIGRHSLVVTPGYGPRVRLSCLLTEAVLKPTPRLADNLCDGCNECIAACPAGALSEPEKGEAYAINKYACKVFRNGAGDCSECMRLCPAGR